MTKMLNQENRRHFFILVSVFLTATASMAGPTTPKPRTVVAMQTAASITTYAADCGTPQVRFNLGDTICAKAEGLSGFRFAFVNPDGYILQRTAITSDLQFDSFAVPTTGESSLAGGITTNNLGTWRVNSVTSTNAARMTAFLTVSDPANARVDLAIAKNLASSQTPTAGSSFDFLVSISNLGPDDATNTHFVDDTFTNASFNSLRQTSGPTFMCSGGDCSIANLPSGSVANFVVNFTAGSAGGFLSNTARVSSAVTELNGSDNTVTTPGIKVGSGGAPPDCDLECPNNMVVSANTTQNGTPGAFVTLPSAEAFGNCGTVTLSPASGSFFAAGMTTVQATSSSGGGACSFTVNVIETPAPTIICPPNRSAAAASGQSSAFVPDPTSVASNPGFPTATGSNVTIVGDRTDDQDLAAAYPIGLTTITWTATDDGGRAARCIQTITITSADAPAISCPPSKNVTAPGTACEITLTGADLGVPTTSGLHVTVTAQRSDRLELFDPYPAGETSITWTATNDIGSASCIQIIRVKVRDTQPPSLTIPADITTTTDSCSAVLDDELGVATAKDNCTTSVSIARSGVPPNFLFPTGTTNVTYTASDGAGNQVSAVQRVTVLEAPAVRPTIAPPADVTAFTGPAATACNAVVSNATLGTATASDNCAGVAVARAGVASGNLFPVGTTSVIYTATDASGNTATATQYVTILDNTPPTIACPSNKALEPTCPSGAVAAWVAPVGADNCAATTSRTGGLPSGSVFPIGATTVTYTATDAAGNQTSCSFTVTVLTVPATIENLKAAVQSSPLAPPQSQGLLPKLDTALSAISRGQSTPACQGLANFVKQVQNYIDHGELSPAQGEAWMTTAKHLSNALGCTNQPCS